MTCESLEHVEVRTATFTDHDARTLIAAADAYNAHLYGHPDQTPIQPDEFDPAQGGLFLVAYRDGVPAGCGGYRRATDTNHTHHTNHTAEFKRLYVQPTARRHGIARALLTQLEEHARKAGYNRAILDVGSKQHAAHTLYETSGYHRIPGFSIYRDRPGNRAYAKDL